MAVKHPQEAQNPLILRCNRLIEAFAKSDDERDFYLDHLEGFILYVDLDKSEEELLAFEKELAKNKERYAMIPKLSFYETKKIMEGFVNEKVYDIDTKEKLLDIIHSKEAREHFLDFIYDHHSELEKWQTYYQERSRIRIIEWLRNNDFHFVFEEDLEMPKLLIEKLKRELFQTKVGKEILTARKTLQTKAKTYYSNEALNPRPKRGRPPKLAQKTEVEQQITTDIYTCVPGQLRDFLFTPDLGTTLSTFSTHFGNEEELFHKRIESHSEAADASAETLTQKLAALRSLSNKWIESENAKPRGNADMAQSRDKSSFESFDEEDEDEDEFDDELYTSKGKIKNLNGKKRLPARETKVTKTTTSETKTSNRAKSDSAKKAAPKPPFLAKTTKASSKSTATTKLSKASPKKGVKPAATSKKTVAAKKQPAIKPVSKPKSGVLSKKKTSSNSTKKALRPIQKLKKKKS